MTTKPEDSKPARRHLHRRSGIALTLCGLFLLPLGCASTGVNQGQINLVSYVDEWRMGQQLEAELARKLRLVNDPPALAYVTQIGQRIVRQSELADKPWKFHIVADPAINAFAIPGGQVYVNTGLILAAGNASELAGVIAHEISHGVARHSTERLTALYGLDLVGGRALGQNPSTTKKIAAQIAAGGLVARHSRGAEREADRLGVRYMYDAGYDPSGMATMFEKLLTTRQRRPSSVEQFFSSHPLAEDRIVAVREQTRSLPARQGLVTRDGSLSGVQQRVRRYNS